MYLSLIITALDDEYNQEEERNSRKNSVSSSDSYTPRANTDTDKFSMQVKGSEKQVKQRRHSGSESDSSMSSSTTSTRSDSIDRTPRPLSPVRKRRDDFFDKPGPTFVFRTETSQLANKEQPKSSSQHADVSMDTTSSEQDSQSKEEFLSGYKVGF